jgi:hypothetical protein
MAERKAEPGPEGNRDGFAALKRGGGKPCCISESLARADWLRYHSPSFQL